MLAKITLENFFSFGKSTTIELNPGVNILVGINGSGKSNFLKAIRLLKESIVGEGFEKLFLKDWGGFNSVCNFNNERSDYIKLCFEFDFGAILKGVGSQGYLLYQFNSNPIYEITVYQSGATSYYLKEKLFTKGHESTEPYVFIEMENSRGAIYTITDEREIIMQNYPLSSSQISFTSTEPVLRQISDPNNYALNTIKRALGAFSVYDYFDTTLKSVLRQPGSYGTEVRLLPDGQNLTALLSSIKNRHALAYNKIEEYIKTINPNFKDIDVGILGSKLILFLREQYLSKSISIEHISDGTLRHLLFLSIFLNPERGNLICIDEPENGLHPDMINTIAKLIKEAAADGTQLIIATHSPLLLNSFELDDVLIFEKENGNQTAVHVKSEEEFESWNDDFLVGQLWLRGLIGGKRW